MKIRHPMHLHQPVSVRAVTCILDLKPLLYLLCELYREHGLCWVYVFQQYFYSQTK